MHEESKYEGKVAPCADLWLFGECKKQSCQLRHILGDIDKPADELPVNTFVKFEIVEIASVTSFIVKILAHDEGGQWSSWEEKNEKIEKSLKQLQDFCQMPNIQKAAEVMIGNTYVVLINKDNSSCWRRCSVIGKDDRK